MKAINKIWVLAALLPFVLFSCKKAELTYEPGEPDLANCYGVYFPTQEASGSHTFDPEMDRIITVTVARKADQPLINEEIKVPYTVKSSEENIFQIGEIVFASGQSETTIDITFDKAEEGVKYDLSIQLEDPQYASLYASNPTELKLDVMVVAWQYILNPQTKEKAVFTFTQEYWGETCWAYVKYYDLDGVWTCQTESFLHDYKGEQRGPDTGDYGFWGNTEAEGEGELQFKIYSKELNADGNMYMELIPSVIYHHSSYDADVVLYDWYYYFTVYNPQAALQGVSWINFAKNYSSNYPLGYYDNNGGLFFFAHGRYMMGIGGWTMDSYDVIGIGEGFIRTDYSLSLEADYPSNGATPVYVTAGRDVKTIQYAIYPGKLSENEAEKKAEAIAAKEEESESFSEFEYDETKDINYATLSVSPETSGQYTIVAVALDEKNNAQNSAHTVFNFISADDQEDYLVTISAFTEDTPARYKELHNYDSFAFGIAGEDITEAHVGIFTAADVQKYGAEYIVNVVKTDANGRYTLPESAVADINIDGGYYDIASGLAAKTTYYVIVWATNGSMENIASASYTTEKLPYVWNSLGKGTITDGFLNLYKSAFQYTGECDVYEEAKTPGLYMVTGYQCAMVAAYFGVSEETMANYKGGNWDDSELVIDATDPDKVFIETQSYGICLNSNDGFINITSINGGKHFSEGSLKNGEITFPSRGMITILPGAGKSYYGNTNGYFKVTLPGTSAPTLTPANVNANAVVKNEVVSSKANFVEIEMPVLKYERDAQPVKAKVNVSYERKEKVGKDDSKALESLRVSFK